MSDLQNIIEEAFERRAVADKASGDWVVNEWLKKAVLLSFRINDNEFIKGGFTNYYDKVESKFADYNTRDLMLL